MSNAKAIKENKKMWKDYFDFEKYPDIIKEFNIKATGVSFENEDSGTDRQLVIKDTSLGEHLMLIPEGDNPYDGNAVRIVRFDGMALGYLPKGPNKQIFDKLDKQIFVDAELIDKPNFDGTYGAVLKLSIYGKK